MATDRGNSIQRTLNRILGRRVELLQKQAAAEKKVAESVGDVANAQKGVNDALAEGTKSTEKAIDAHKRYARSAKDIVQSQGRIRSLMAETKEIVKDTAKTYGRDMVAGISAAALANKAYQDSVTATSKSTRQWLSTSQRIDDISFSFDAITKRAMQYQKVQMGNTRVAYEFGATVQEVTNISDKWIQTLRYNEVTDVSQKSLEKLTEQTLLYSRVLGTDANRLQEEAAQRMFKYGESHDEALTNIVRVRHQVVALNDDLRDLFPNQAAIFDDDFQNRLDAVAKGTKGYTQDLGNMSAALSVAIERGQKMGMTYNQSMDAAEKFANFLSGNNLDQRTQTMVGLDLLEKFQENIGPGGKISEDYLAQFNPQIQSQLQMIAQARQRGQVDTIVARRLQSTLASTEQGMGAQLDLLQNLAGRGGDVAHILQRMGMDEMEAYTVSDLLASGGGREELMGAIRRSRGAASNQARTAGGEDAMRRMSLGHQGAVGTLAAEAVTGRNVGRDAGQYMAYLEDSRVTGAAAGGIAAFGIAGRLYDAYKKGGVSGAMGEIPGALSEQAGVGGGAGDTYGGGSGAAGAIPADNDMANAVAIGVDAVLQKYTTEGNMLRVSGAGGEGPGGPRSMLGDLYGSYVERKGQQTDMAKSIMRLPGVRGVLGKMIVSSLMGGGATAAAGGGAAATGAGGIGAGTVAAGGAVVGGGALATLAAIGAAGTAVAGAFSAPAAGFFAAGSRMNRAEALLRKVKGASNRKGPLGVGIGKGLDPGAWAKISKELAQEPDSVVQGLVKDGVIAPELGQEVLMMKRASTMTQSVASAIPQASNAAMAQNLAGGGMASAALGEVANILPNGDVILRIVNGMAIPAAYDKAKSDMY